MEPLPKIKLEHIILENKNIILLQVSSGNETPYYITDGGNQVAYIRVGNESIPAKNHDLINLILKGMDKSYDSLITEIRKNTVSFSKLKAVYYKKTGSDLSETDFESFGLMNEEGYLSKAGVLLADEYLLRHSRIFCTKWNGLDKVNGLMEAYDDEEIEGSILLQLQNATNFVKTNSKKRWKKGLNSRIEMPDYPERAVQEAIVNAIIHRDYSQIGSEIHLDMYDDRLEIYSPGGMYDGSLIQDLNLFMISSKRRNPIIADLFSRMNLMERRGSGLKKIHEEYVTSYHFMEDKKVQFFSTKNEFCVIMKNLNYKAAIESGDKAAMGITENQLEKILDYIDSHVQTKTSDIEKLLSIKSSRARHLILMLVKNEKIIAVGKNKNRYYISNMNK